jgi:hypothetical protein
MKLGPFMLVAELAEFGVTVAASTIHRVLLRRGISRLRDLDLTGENMRQPTQRYGYPVAHPACTSTRSPAAWCMSTSRRSVASLRAGVGGCTARVPPSTGRPSGVNGPGNAFLHTALDDRSRLSSTEELTDERSVTAAAFWARAVESFAARRREIERC